MRRIATIVGAGAWGTAAAHLLSQNCDTVYLWASQPAVVEQIQATRCNEAYLPGVRLPSNIIASTDWSGDIAKSPLFVWAIPVQFLRARARLVAAFVRTDFIAVNLGKGLEEDSWARPSQILAEECRHLRAVGSLVGPNLAAEVAAGMYSEATLGLSDQKWLDDTAAHFAAPSFRVHTTTDTVGIEIGAALKNVCAIAAGLCDGLGLGANTKSLVIAASLEEIRQLGACLGAAPETLASGCVLADLLTSCYSSLGRNRRVGEYLGQGHSVEQAVALLGGRVAEGVATCRACHALRRSLGLPLPVVDGLHALLEGRLDARTCVGQILAERVYAAG